MSLATHSIAQDQPDIVWTRPAGHAAAVSFSPDGTLLAAQNAGVDLWRVADGTLVRSISGSFGGIGSLSFSPDSLLLAAGDGDGVVRVWNVWDGNLAWSQRASGDVTSVLFAPDGSLASWSSDKDTIDLWRTADGMMQRSLPGHQWSHFNVAFSPDGALAASGGDMDPVVKLLSVADGSVVRSLVGHTGRVRTVAFSSDGSLLASAGDDATIRVWRVEDGTSLYTLTNHTEMIWKLALAPNGTLASASTDGTLRLWRLTDGTLLRTYATQLGGSLSVEFSPDSSLFAFESDGQVILARNPFPAITRQPSRLTRFAGQAAALAVAATGDAPLTYQWCRNSLPLASATNAGLTLANLRLADNGIYTVEISSPLGTVVSRAVDLAVLPRPTGPGSLDVSFDPTGGGDQPGFAGGAPGVRAMVLAPDGRFLIGGRFAAVNGTARRHLARLQQDGTVDPSFHPGLGLDGEVTAMARQTDGSIVAAGVFTAADGQSHGLVARLDRHGKVDPGFRVTLAGAAWTTITYPTSVAVQSDGHIWVCGSFTEVNGVPCTNVARLHPDGTLDQSFRLDEVQGNDFVDRVFVQPNDMVILGGRWTNPVCSLVRLQPDGTLDSSFVGTQVTVSDAGTPGRVSDLATHLDGRIAIAGYFTAVNGMARNRIAWLQPDGTLDASFDPGSGPEDGSASRVLIEPDGRVVVGGVFSRVQGSERPRLARFNPDGRLDLTFDPWQAIREAGLPSINALVRQSDGRYLIGAGEWLLEPTNCVLRLGPSGRRDPSLHVALQIEPYEVQTALVQPDGRVLVAGGFTNINGVARPGLARLGRDGLLDRAFSPPADLSLEVWALAVQRDQRILVGGLNTSATDGPAMVRLEPDGRRDVGFSGPTVSGPLGLVATMALQPDGRILIGGRFTNVAGLARCGIARLDSDGSVDEAFIPPSRILSGDSAYDVGHLHVLPDRRVLIAGGFSGQSEALTYVARLHADGSLDSTFVPELPERRDIRTMAVQADGRILLAARFPTGTNWEGRLLRLTADGAVDPTFQAEVGEAIDALAVQPDGRILVATNSRVSGGVVRLHPDGARDLSWAPPVGTGGEYPGTRTLVLQPDGQVIVVGAWQSISGVPRPGIARLNNDALAARLAAGGITPRGYFQFSVQGYAGVRYVLEASEDLQHWDPVVAFIHPGGQLELSDPEAWNFRQRFYRARIEP